MVSYVLDAFHKLMKGDTTTFLGQTFTELEIAKLRSQEEYHRTIISEIPFKGVNTVKEVLNLVKQAYDPENIEVETTVLKKLYESILSVFESNI